MSFSEAGEECKDGILWPALPGSTSAGSGCVLRLTLRDQQAERLGVCFSLLPVHALGIVACLELPL